MPTYSGRRPVAPLTCPSPAIHHGIDHSVSTALSGSAPECLLTVVVDQSPRSPAPHPPFITASITVLVQRYLDPPLNIYLQWSSTSRPAHLPLTRHSSRRCIDHSVSTTLPGSAPECLLTVVVDQSPRSPAPRPPFIMASITVLVQRYLDPPLNACLQWPSTSRPAHPAPHPPFITASIP